MRVVIVEDDSRYRSSLETLLEHAASFECVASFAAAEPMLDAARRRQASTRREPWDLAIVDLELPGIDGIETTRRLKKIEPGLRVVVLTSFEHPGLIVEAIQAGADGYLVKKEAPGSLLRHLRSIAEGGAPLTAGVARTVLDLVRRSTAGARGRGPAASRFDMTEREQDVLRCMVRGMAYKEAAAELDISLDTVRTHVRSIYRKLQVHSAPAAVSKAVRERLI